ncbi:hypothetical protein [Streptomyces sp. SID13031]|uniref:hypothetical protein n=1 Tax=Streptomyces sp. SID13031 TaxID=2706046 RepID=UPI0013C64AFC|nr:hypothetical protein [Streptomyces sp. SID13031]NEA33260.1 hypothetical protein [Streptomyces sp. SID13031]
MTSRDLKDLLQTVAANGTDRVAVDEQTLIPRIRSRRRRRAGLAAAVGASTAVVIAAAAFAVLPNGDQKQPPVAAPNPVPTVTLKPDRVKGFACGSPLTGAITGDPSLRLDLNDKVLTVDARGFAGPFNAQLTNTGSKSLDLFGTPYGPWIVVVKDGVVVGGTFVEAQPGKGWKFAPGQTITVPTSFSARQCTPDGLEGSARLAPGTYQLYATKDLRQKSDLPSGIVAAGGPWTVELK